MVESEINPTESQILENTILFYREHIEGSPMAVGQVAIMASKEFGKNPLQEMQKILDKHKIEIKFIAIPKDSDVNRKGIFISLGIKLPSDVREYDIRMPNSGDTDLPFWLWITCSKPEEYSELLEKLEISPDENFIRLSQTGMVSVREESEKSKILHSGLN